jgi:hypothetical protein
VLDDAMQPECNTGGEWGWRSRAFGHREESPVILGRRTSSLPVSLAAVLNLDRSTNPLRLHVSEDVITVESQSTTVLVVRFSGTGFPEYTAS